jgi:hypothetical protein
MPDLELQPHQLARADRMVRILELTSRLSYAAVVTPDPDLIGPFVRAVIAATSQPGLEFRVRWIGWAGLSETTNAIESMMDEDGDDALRIVIVDLSQVPRESLEDARNFAARLNLRRDPFARRFVGLFMLCLPDWLEIPLAGAAPDLWSVMTVEHLERSSGDFDPVFDEWWTSCDQRFDELVASREEAPPRYEHGTCSYAYAIEPGKVDLPLAELKDLLAAVPGYTGWRPWFVPPNKYLPYSHQSALECWLFGPELTFTDPAHADFWRAAGSGMLYLRRGYEEDSNPDRLSVGSTFSTSLPLWRCGEVILHTRDFGRLLNLRGHVRVHVRVRWTGLQNRVLTTWPAQFARITESRSRIPSVTSEVRFTLDQIDQDLTDLVDQLTAPLFESFDFHRNSPTFIAQQLAELQRMVVP